MLLEEQHLCEMSQRLKVTAMQRHSNTRVRNLEAEGARGFCFVGVFEGLSGALRIRGHGFRAFEDRLWRSKAAMFSVPSLWHTFVQAVHNNICVQTFYEKNLRSFSKSGDPQNHIRKQTRPYNSHVVAGSDESTCPTYKECDTPTSIRESVILSHPVQYRSSMVNGS